MITYVLSQVHRFLCEALSMTAAPQVTVNRTKYLVHVDGVVHHVRRDGVCDCGGTAKSPCAAIPLVQAYLAAGGEKPLGRHPDTWPESWLRVPTECPLCGCPTVPDRYLDSRAGPGWRCTLEPIHFWQVRMEPLRRYRLSHPPEPAYPWYDTPIEERVWKQSQLSNETEGEHDRALYRTPPCEGCPWAGIAVPWLDPVRLYRGQVRPDDRLLCTGELGRDRGT